MKSPKIHCTLFVILSLLIAHAASGEGRYVLFANGRTDYKIVVDANTTPGEKLAAEELAKYLKEISGADFGIVNEFGRTGSEIVIRVVHSH